MSGQSARDVRRALEGVLERLEALQAPLSVQECEVLSRSAGLWAAGEADRGNSDLTALAG